MTGVLAQRSHDLRVALVLLGQHVCLRVELLRAAQPLSGGLLGRAFSLEVLPNRDALPYATLYGIEGQAATFFLALTVALTVT